MNSSHVDITTIARDPDPCLQLVFRVSKLGIFIASLNIYTVPIFRLLGTSFHVESFLILGIRTYSYSIPLILIERRHRTILRQ